MTHKENLGTVFDCNIFFQATRNANGPAAKALRLVETGAFSLFLSNLILQEIRETLTDPDVRAKNRWLTDEAIDALIQYLAIRATPIQAPRSAWTVASRWWLEKGWGKAPIRRRLVPCAPYQRDRPERDRPGWAPRQLANRTISQGVPESGLFLKAASPSRRCAVQSTVIDMRRIGS